VAILHTKTDRWTVVPYTYNEIGERTIHHMEECGWIGDTQRGQNCIYIIYDDIHCNALRLNKENVSVRGSTNAGKPQPTNDTVNTGLENKDQRKREGDQPNTSTAQETDTHSTNNTRKTDNNTHTDKKI
jgi:hypothetical protein